VQTDGVLILHATCFPDARHDVRLSLDEAADVMATGMDDSATFVVHYARIHAYSQYKSALFLQHVVGPSRSDRRYNYLLKCLTPMPDLDP